MFVVSDKILNHKENVQFVAIMETNLHGLPLIENNCCEDSL